MRSLNRWRLIGWLLLALALLLVGAWAAGWIPAYAQYCEYNPYTDHEKCTSYQIAIVAIRYIARFLDAVSPALTALATGFIGFFTYTLYKSTAGLKQSTDKLWDAGERQIKVAVDSAKAAENAASAAQRSAEIANRALITTERAFVYLEDFVPDWAIHRRASSFEFTRFIVKPRWRNSGTTPTKNMTIRVNWTHWSGDNKTGIGIYDENETPIKMFLAPNAIEWSAAIEIPGRVATAAAYRSERIIIWGRVDYDDIFEGTPHHFTEWCYQLHITEGRGEVDTQFVAYSDYNCSDEDARDGRQRA